VQARLGKNIRDIVLFALLCFGLAYLALQGGERLGYHWQWYRVPRYILFFQDGAWHQGPLLQGLWMTFKLTGAAFGLAFLFGLGAAMLRLSDSMVGRWIARAYLETVRNTPLLVQIFFIYFVLSPVVDMGRFVSAVLALSLFEGAYASEIIRSGIVSIAKGQKEAAQSLGLSGWQTYRHVILPQALRRTLPPLTGIAVNLVKDSALVSTISIAELAMRGQVIISETFLTFEIWFTVAGMYLCVTLLLSFAARLLERRLNVGQ
jgi:polar amino acid transport system permease protein